MQLLERVSEAVAQVLHEASLEELISLKMANAPKAKRGKPKVPTTATPGEEKKKRGRPKGSRNKPAIEADSVPQS